MSERREFGHVYLRGRKYWIRYQVDGITYRESAKTKSEKVAERLLVARQTELSHGILTPAVAKNVYFSDLEELIRAHYRATSNKSLRRADEGLIHLRESFEGCRATAISTKSIKTYVATRMNEGAARATINYELAILRKAFKEAIESKMLQSMPTIKTPNPKNARKGFFEPADFDAVYNQLPNYLQGIMRLAYFTGWRGPSEILTLKWSQVDFKAGEVRLEPNTTKNSEGRTFPFTALPQLVEMFAAQREYTTKVERREQMIVQYVFHRSGKPIKNYYAAWRRALKRAAEGRGDGVRRPHILGAYVHDFRRTAVRNLVRAGVPSSTAMKLTGHKTRAIFDRYNIVDDEDLRDGVARLGIRMAGLAKGTEEAQSVISAAVSAS